MVSSSIIIPTHERAGLLSRTLDSLACQSEGDFEVIVVCDGEDAPTRALSETSAPNYPLRWIFLPENEGPASARNAGAFAAQGDILLFLDDDTSASRDWLACHRKCRLAMPDPERMVVLGRRRDLYERAPLSHTERLLRESREKALTEFEDRCIRLGKDFSWFPHCGMNSSICRATFLQAGGYDPAPPLSRYAEDLELGNRLASRGIRMIYEPRAIVYHHDSENLTDRSLHLARLQGKSDLYRVAKKQQRCEQTQRLASLHRSRYVRRVKERLAWGHPEEVARAAELCRKLTDLTGSKFFWRQWSALATSVEYWNSVRAEGMTPQALSQLVGSPVPVLMFHSVCAPRNALERDWYIAPNRFRRFAAWLKMKGYHCLPAEEWLAGNRPSHEVILTFDDGYDDFYTEAFPVLERYGLRATVFAVVECIGQSNTWDEVTHLRSRRLLTHGQVRELHRHGVTFGSHSLTHPLLTVLSDKDLRREVSESKSRLEDLLGSEVTCFAYPGGAADSRVRAAVAEAGYRIAMSIGGGLNYWEDPLRMTRINVSERDSLPGVALKVVSGRSAPEHMLECLIQTARASLNVLPDPLAEVFRRELRGLYGVASTRWWRWKEARLMRPAGVPDYKRRAEGQPELESH